MKQLKNVGDKLERAKFLFNHNTKKKRCEKQKKKNEIEKYLEWRQRNLAGAYEEDEDYDDFEGLNPSTNTHF